MTQRKYISNLVVVSTIITQVAIGCRSVWEYKPETTCGVNYISLPYVSNKSRAGQCGIIAIEQLLYKFKKVKPGQIKYHRLPRGIFANTLNLVFFAKENGLSCELTKMNINELYKELNESRPVIIVVPPGSTWFARRFSKILAAHCIVVVGYSNDKIYFYSDGSGLYFIEKEHLLFLWENMDNVAIRILT